MFWPVLIVAIALLVGGGIIQKMNDLAAMWHISREKRDRHELLDQLDAPVDMPPWYVIVNGFYLVVRGLGVLALIAAVVLWLIN
jgi:hypothetical protein